MERAKFAEMVNSHWGVRCTAIDLPVRHLAARNEYGADRVTGRTHPGQLCTGCPDVTSKRGAVDEAIAWRDHRNDCAAGRRVHLHRIALYSPIASPCGSQCAI